MRSAFGQVSLNGCPDAWPVGLRVGVRAILENSTACQKSMPSFVSFLWGGSVFWGCFMISGFSLVDLELSQLLTCSARLESVTLRGLFFPSPFGVLGFEHQRRV
jgi:hypothetical protein